MDTGYIGLDYQDVRDEINLFVLRRTDDETGVSGTGSVAEGVEFSNGKCVLNWRTAKSSIAVYDNMKELEAIHCHGGKSHVVILGKNPSK